MYNFFREVLLMIEASEEFEKGGFTSSRFSYQHYPLIALYLQVNILQNIFFFLSVPERKVLKRNKCFFFFYFFFVQVVMVNRTNFGQRLVLSHSISFHYSLILCIFSDPLNANS